MPQLIRSAKQIVSLAILLLASSITLATEPSLRPGGIALVPLGPSDATAPTVRLGDQPVMLIERAAEWVAVIGIPLDTEPGELAILVNDNAVLVDIDSHAYREQRLTVENNSYVEQNQQQLDRIWRERKLLDAGLTNFRDVAMTSLNMQAPIAGSRSSSFGYRRFFNDQPRSPHKGMDISGANGEPILAAAAGVVTVTGDFFL